MSDKEKSDIEFNMGNAIPYLHTLDSYHVKDVIVYKEIQKTATIVLEAVNKLLGEN